jgi:hypothetical protein
MQCRFEDPKTGKVTDLIDTPVPDSKRKEAQKIADYMGADFYAAANLLPGVNPIDKDDIAEMYLNNTWRFVCSYSPIRSTARGKKVGSSLFCIENMPPTLMHTPDVTLKCPPGPRSPSRVPLACPMSALPATSCGPSPSCASGMHDALTAAATRKLRLAFPNRAEIHIIHSY